jgi:hypothetical protein
MAEIAGLALGVVGVVGPLLNASLAGYDVLSNAQGVGADIDKFVWRLGVEKHRLDKWGQECKLEDPEFRDAMQVDEKTLKQILGAYPAMSRSVRRGEANLQCSDPGAFNYGTTRY